MRDSTHIYQLRIKGTASDNVRAAFDDLNLYDVPSQTVIRTRGRVDNTELYGLISRIESLGLVLLQVREMDSNQPPLRATADAD